jgi:hypothetical protein
VRVDAAARASERRPEVLEVLRRVEVVQVQHVDALLLQAPADLRQHRAREVLRQRVGPLGEQRARELERLLPRPAVRRDEHDLDAQRAQRLDPARLARIRGEQRHAAGPGQRAQHLVGADLAAVVEGPGMLLRDEEDPRRRRHRAKYTTGEVCGRSTRCHPRGEPLG